MRLIAATQVLVFHTIWHLDLHLAQWVDVFRQFEGVPIFFVISGYLISASYERSGSSSVYFQNRALRIYPALWACILVTVMVAMLFGFNFWNVSAAKWFVAQLGGIIYTPAFLHSFGFGAYNGSLWTIPIELQFYCVLPLIYLLARRVNSTGHVVFLGAFVVFSAIAVWEMYAFPDLGNPHASPLVKAIRTGFFTQFYIFLAGALLQRFAVYRFRFIAGKGLFWLLGYASLTYSLPHSPLAEYLRMLALAMTVISLAYTLPGTAQRLLHGQDISYGVYIYHGLIVNILGTLGLSGAAGYLLLVLFATYAAATVSWLAIERRFLRKKRQALRIN